MKFIVLEGKVRVIPMHRRLTFQDAIRYSNEVLHGQVSMTMAAVLTNAVLTPEPRRNSECRSISRG